MWLGLRIRSCFLTPPYMTAAAWRCTIWGYISILFISPLLGTLRLFSLRPLAELLSSAHRVAALLCARLPLQPREFRTGLALFYCMPTV